MKLYQFTITVDEDLSDVDLVDAFYGKVDDASVSVADGQSLIQFDREADSLDRALNTAIASILNEGWKVCEILIEPNCLLPLAAP